MSGYRLTVVGSAIEGNDGASAMLESAVQTLTERLGDVEFTLLSMYRWARRAAAHQPDPARGEPRAHQDPSLRTVPSARDWRALTR